MAVLAALLWRGSDAAATSRTTSAPAGDLTGSPAGALSQAWSASGDVLPRQVVEGGRVVVGARHGITALDPLTGAPAWHYTRSNARLCGLTATDGLVVAVFRTAHRCDEALALHAGTGGYAWTRSVNFDPGVTLTSTSHLVLAVSRGSVVAIDPVGDNIRWRYSPDGCRVVEAVPGSAGVAVLLRCSGTPALRLRLLDGTQGNAVWTRDLPVAEAGRVALAGADRGVSVVAGGELQLLAPGDGAVVASAPLPAAADGAPSPLADVAGPAVLVWAHGTLTALDPTAGTVLWQRPALGLPTASGSVKIGPDAGRLLIPEEGGFVARDPLTGEERGRSAVDGLPAGGTSTPVGPVVVYRAPDRVLAYR